MIEAKSGAIVVRCLCECVFECVARRNHILLRAANYKRNREAALPASGAIRLCMHCAVPSNESLDSFINNADQSLPIADRSSTNDSLATSVTPSFSPFLCFSEHQPHFQQPVPRRTMQRSSPTHSSVSILY